jgi:Protein of unknown function (DUF1566)
VKYFALVLLSVAAIIASVSPAPEGQGRTHERQAHGFWIDPSAGLMWAAKDNGKDVTWKKAMSYCRDLRLAGYSDWRLASMAELQPIYDRTANSPGLAGRHDDEPTLWHVKGNLFLTGYEWSSNYRFDDRGHPSGYAYYFDINEGKPNDDEKGYSTFKHALCVRSPKMTIAGPPLVAGSAAAELLAAHDFGAQERQRNLSPK